MPAIRKRISNTFRSDARQVHCGSGLRQRALRADCDSRPKGLKTLQKLTATNLSEIKYYWFTDGALLDVPARIARTGYTGEDGFEIYFEPHEAARLWNEILKAGEEFGIKPCGLGARNTLRLEAKMALYGHELNCFHQSA